MRTILFDNAPPLADDAELMKQLPAVEVPTLSGGVVLSIGIEGPANSVYRIIETQSLIEAIGVFEVLQRFGLRSAKSRRVAKSPWMRSIHAVVTTPDSAILGVVGTFS